MSKSKAAVTGTLRITTQGQLLSIQGTLVEQTAEFVTLDVKRRGSKKTDRTTYAAADIKLAFVSDAQNETYLSVIGDSVDDYQVELQEIAGGYFSGTMGDSAVLAAPGTWTFLPDVSEDEESAPTTAKAPAKAAAKATTKAKAEPEQEEEEEEETPAYEPEKGDYVKVVDEDEEETEGEVELINAKTIKVGGVKFNRADVTVTAAEAPAAEEEEEETTTEEEEYEPADGDYVSVTDSDDEVVTGTITGLTAKKITITDADDEEHGFMLSKVTVALAEKPKKGAKAAAKPDAKAAAKPEGKSGAAKPGKAAAENDDW